MNCSTELEQLYIKVGTAGWKDNGIDLERIWELEDAARPKEKEVEIEENRLESVCGGSLCMPSCCWECAAIRGGCPEDV